MGIEIRPPGGPLIQYALSKAFRARKIINDDERPPLGVGEAEKEEKTKEKRRGQAPR